ncbi:bacteriocin immunity protein [Carnobacterium mobile]|uniref:bacteriocin immunity protein n=1 Tax=Carnobacterium mobile TaxID=2750 RepID=UPI0005500F9A|nr:bacteriocin immunity protein [Carnobacterium mobile]
MKNESKPLVHDLHNSLDQPNMEDIKEVLLKVYTKLEESKENVPLINRLVNFIYFTGCHQKLTFSKEQESLIRKLSEIGQTAGVNGVYRSSYGDKTQF